MLLTRHKVVHTLHTYVPDPRHESYGAEAAEALGVSPERVFKTLVADVGERALVGVLPITGQLDLKALAAVAGAKRARMAEAATAQRVTGYMLGGISPFGHRSRLPVVVDASIEQFDTVLCSGGRRGLEIEVAPADLVRLTNATVAHIRT